MARRFPHGDARRRVVQAAARLFSRKGFAGTSVGEIAARAQASPSSIYWHFKGGKDAILLAVIDEAAESFITSLVDAVRSGSGLDAKVHILFSEAQRQIERGPESLRLLMQMGLERADQHPEVRQRIVEIYARYRGLIADELRAFVPPALQPRADAVAVILLATLQGIFLQWQLDPDGVDLDAVFDHLRATVGAQLREL
jgi:TetR/AcrR family fatty acid metabolism transcriptional regulator